MTETSGGSYKAVRMSWPAPISGTIEGVTFSTPTGRADYRIDVDGSMAKVHACDTPDADEFDAWEPEEDRP